jgi:hypothetical protein
MEARRRISLRTRDRPPADARAQRFGVVPLTSKFKFSATLQNSCFDAVLAVCTLPRCMCGQRISRATLTPGAFKCIAAGSRGGALTLALSSVFGIRTKTNFNSITTKIAHDLVSVSAFVQPLLSAGVEPTPTAGLT